VIPPRKGMASLGEFGRRADDTLRRTLLTHYDDSIDNYRHNPYIHKHKHNQTITTTSTLLLAKYPIQKEHPHHHHIKSASHGPQKATTPPRPRENPNLPPSPHLPISASPRACPHSSPPSIVCFNRLLLRRCPRPSHPTSPCPLLVGAFTAQVAVVLPFCAAPAPAVRPTAMHPMAMSSHP
jgi:hypothetical protein